MKRIANRGLALLMAVLMCFSLLTVTGTHAHAASNYVYNWGVRGTVATALSERAEAFYTGNNTYANLSQLPGGTSQANAPSSTLYNALQKLMKDAHSYETSYQGTRVLYQYTDCQNGGGRISSFYSGKAIGPDWDAGATWNREHVWPDSKGDASGNGENDIMMLRPTAKDENGSRSNTAYGESSGYYFPNSESNGNYDVRGDVARVVLYVYTRWGNTGSMWGTGGVIENQEILLKWMEQDPVDTWEMGRNDSVQSITGTRNVFVDYPELAFKLFGQQVPANMSTPSNGKTPSGHTHSYGSGVVTAPTCSAQGYTTFTCSDTDCGYSFKTDYTNKVGHSFADGVCTVCGASATVGGGTSGTLTVTVADLATANNWVNATKYTDITLNDVVSVTASDGQYNGAYYASGNSWRIYQTDSGTFTISAEGTVIDSVKVTYSKKNSGIMTYNGENVNSNVVVTVDASSATFGVGNTGGNTNGQIHITAFEIVYGGDNTGGNEGGNEGGNTGGDGGNTGGGDSGEVTPSVPTYVTEIATGKAYKLGLYSTAKSAEYYFTGTMSGYYGATSEVYTDGVDVYVEETTGGYYLYFLSGGEKQYISLVASGTHLNFVYDTTANSVFTWDATKYAMYTTVGTEICYMGTYKNFVTVGVLSTSKMEDTNYIARFYTVNNGSGEEPACDHSWNAATCTAPKTCSKCGETEGTSLGHSYSDGICSGCGQADPNAPKKNGLCLDEDGMWKYYVNGVVDTDYVGLVNYGGTLFYVINGVWDGSCTGLVESNGTLYYVTGSVVDTGYNSLAMYNNVWYCVRNGVVDTGYTGMTQFGGTLFYAINGVWDGSYTGLVESDGTLYYVAGSVMDTNYNSLAMYNNVWYCVRNGVVDTGYTGVTQFGGTLFYAVNGVWDGSCTGLVESDGTLYYVVGSVQNTTYNSLAVYNNVWYYVENGVANTGYTGMVQFGGTWFYAINGVWDGSCTGLVEHNGELYYVVGSVQDVTYNSLAIYNNIWHYVANGKVDTAYVGLTNFGGNLFYVANGVWDYTFSGTVDDYQVVGGVAIQ